MLDVMATHLRIGVQRVRLRLRLFGVQPLGTCADLAAGAAPSCRSWPPLRERRATETASNAAEMVFNMVVSLIQRGSRGRRSEWPGSSIMLDDRYVPRAEPIAEAQ